ncbi:MAG TPA: hypothetical protein VM345_10785 [Acidimicrobiales bacterium]|nr:hypothetical protein [Acidimicrobiales bacterium]
MPEPKSAAPLTPHWMGRGERLPWSWALDRIEAEKNYWIVSVRTDGFPQARPVWGVWSEAGLLLSVGGGGLARAERRSALPVTVHLDDAIDVVIIEGTIDRFAGPAELVTTAIDEAARREAIPRYNEKYSWNFEPDTDMLNFVVRPHTVLGWHSTPTAVEGGTKWTF